MDIPDIEPDTVHAGTRIRWTRTVPDHEAGDGWSVSYWLVRESEVSHRIEVVATGDGDVWTVDVLPDESSQWIPGRYRWQMVATKADDGDVVGTGTIVVAENFATGAVVDTRSHARRVLEAVEAVIEDRATKDQMGYAIGGRSLQRTPLPELMKLRNRYRAMVSFQERGPRTVLARFR